MDDGTRVVGAETVSERGSYLFTAEDAFTNECEVVLVPCEEMGVRAWVNRCPHQSQRFDRGNGAAVRNGELVCPRHGSTFDTCEGDCDNGPAAGTSLTGVDVAVVEGDVYLTDESYTYLHDGPADSGGSSSSSHISF